MYAKMAEPEGKHDLLRATGLLGRVETSVGRGDGWSRERTDAMHA
jgi:hypothetical protein